MQYVVILTVSKMISDLSWMNIEQHLFYFTAILMFKCLNNLAPEYLSNSLKYTHELHPHNTRNASNLNLNIPKPKTSTFMNSFSYQGPLIWNTLPTNVRDSNNIHTFKTHLKETVFVLYFTIFLIYFFLFVHDIYVVYIIIYLITVFSTLILLYVITNLSLYTRNVLS